MEEILASIRRIIADDEAKPPVAEKPTSPAPTAKPEKPAAPPPAAKASDAKAPDAKAPDAKAPDAKAPDAKASDAKAPAMTDFPPSAIPAAQAAAAKPVPPPAKPAPAPAPAASNSQDDIDALLNGLDEATSPEEIRPPLPDGDVFELTDDMALPEPPPPPQPSFQKVEPQDDLEFAEAAARAAPRQPAYEPPSFESAATPAQQILSRTTVSAVESAFNSLANTVLSNNARTLEDLVKEMLRPMLKSWLDDNLPGLVERIVKAEIERVSRGR
jgi:cell pole-organizing protein PopZ